MTELAFHNSATRQREIFTPLDPQHVRLYVCGPTVYDLAHLGNARPVVVFDVLARLLRRRFPRVTYVRNITDVDDKINARSQESGEPIAAITARTTADFHRDMAALGCLPPDEEPRATDNIAQMIQLIERLIANGHAYAAEGHVLFSVSSFPGYGALSGRSPDEMLAGARVEIAPYKREAGDFVLWKPSSDDLPGWDSPWGRGRPGWHIECSAMSWRYLGTDFDIHGGGHDLIFPHHENEVAQSVCAFPGSRFARTWLHNGMLLVDGEKMSKSLGNFLTVRDILGRGAWAGEAFRLLLLKTHYRAALDYTVERLEEAKAELDDFYALLARDLPQPEADDALVAEMAEWALEPLADDLNTPLAIARLRDLRTLENVATVGGSATTVLHRIGRDWQPDSGQAAAALRQAAALLGLLGGDARAWRQGGEGDSAAIEAAIQARLDARKAKNWAEADRIRADLLAQGIVLEDGAGGTTWRRA
ncbi:cysteine--tRNA ligase [Pseudoroseomonas cervicalis]|uniref:Cysteine--tRNA ligase n=1 Tax=Pseudoroseomonas cervicalis ATCC 49957 TaxID=525371 RepID=D5RMD4_9PROT|nr:cysteine--tRNA ligase [Pseudoroseomonas cervicalis]EFH11548.1 cysteine--tRNA ligase [Pseudoroseomonas cervicalis ATCC 49957]